MIFHIRMHELKQTMSRSNVYIHCPDPRFKKVHRVSKHGKRWVRKKAKAGITRERLRVLLLRKFRQSQWERLPFPCQGYFFLHRTGGVWVSGGSMLSLSLLTVCFLPRHCHTVKLMKLMNKTVHFQRKAVFTKTGPHNSVQQSCLVVDDQPGDSLSQTLAC